MGIYLEPEAALRHILGFNHSAPCGWDDQGDLIEKSTHSKLQKGNDQSRVCQKAGHGRG
jgi:hypothetical protein